MTRHEPLPVDADALGRPRPSPFFRPGIVAAHVSTAMSASRETRPTAVTLLAGLLAFLGGSGVAAGTQNR